MTADRAPAVFFNSADWRSGVAGWPMNLEWTYFQICMFNWDRNEPVPPGQIKFLLSRNPEWEADLATLIEMGKVIKTAGDSIFNSRALGESKLANRKLDKFRKAGKTGAEKRWNIKDVDSHPNAPPNSRESESKSESLSKKERTPLPPNGNGDLIFSVDPEIWTAFRKHRNKIKGPMTDHAEKLMLRKLESLWNDGHDPTMVIEQSIRKGWKDVFPLKGDQAYGSGSSYVDRRSGFDRTLDDFIDGKK